MNGKVAKLLRKLKLDSKKGKRAWKKLTQIERSNKRLLVKNLTNNMS